MLIFRPICNGRKLPLNENNRRHLRLERKFSGSSSEVEVDSFLSEDTDDGSELLSEAIGVVVPVFEAVVDDVTELVDVVGDRVVV